MRKSCLNCARTHVAQAELLLHRARSEHPLYVWYAIAHLAEAEVELIVKWPGHAEIIHQHRIFLTEDNSYTVPTFRLLQSLTNEAEKMPGVSKAGHLTSSVLQQPLEDAESQSKDGSV